MVEPRYPANYVRVTSLRSFSNAIVIFKTTFFLIKICSILKLVYRRKLLRCSISGVPVTRNCYKRKNNYDRNIRKHIVWNTSFIGADFALSLGVSHKYIIFLFLTYERNNTTQT